MATLTLETIDIVDPDLYVERGYPHEEWALLRREAPVFYGLLTFFVGAAALFILIPGLPLIQVMFLAQVVNGLLLPIILIFVMRLSREANLGDLRSGRLLYPVGWIITALASAMSLAFVGSLVFAR